MAAITGEKLAAHDSGEGGGAAARAGGGECGLAAGAPDGGHERRRAWVTAVARALVGVGE